MGAKYESDKPEGYLNTRNAVFRERERLQQERVYKDASALRNLPPQSEANYGKKSYK